jgi:hypothetical protein
VVSLIDITIFDLRGPLTSLLLDVEMKTSWATEIRKASVRTRHHGSTIALSGNSGIAEKFSGHVADFRVEADLAVESGGVFLALNKD